MKKINKTNEKGGGRRKMTVVRKGIIQKWLVKEETWSKDKH